MDIQNYSDQGTNISAHIEDVWGCTVKPASEALLQKFLPVVEQSARTLEQIGFDIRALKVVVCAGCNTSNGHAFLHEGKPIVWISLDSYPTENTARVFFLHELIHGIHYAATPAYYFDDIPEQKNHVGRQLVTEGLATFGTQVVLGCSDGEALWGDYLTEDELETVMRKYNQNLALAAEKIISDWNRCDTVYFYASDQNDVFAYRIGYFIGLKVLQHINKVHGYTFQQLLQMPREELDVLCKDTLLTFST